LERPMLREGNAPVLIVGAGPVGLTLAIDLAWRGIKVTVAETRPRAQPPEPVQPCRGPDNGNLPAPRHRRKGAQCRAARRLPARRQLPYDLHRSGADAHSN